MGPLLYGILGALIVDVACLVVAVLAGPRLLKAAMRKQAQAAFGNRAASQVTTRQTTS